MQSFGGPRRERLMMTHIELENFLSFPGVQKIGPFRKKFSIRELNDGGKVSLVEALLFVFGKRSVQPENNKSAELIHRSTRYPNMEYCRVSVQFQLIIDDETSEEVYEVLTDSQFVVTRVAYRDNQTEYMLDNRSSRLTNLAMVFMQNGIELDSNRYLFLHGDLAKLPALQPKATGPNEVALLDYAGELFGPGVVSQDYAVAQGRISTPYNTASLNTNNGTPFEQFEPDGFMDPSLSKQYSQEQMMPYEPQKEGQSGMQRLVDKVINVFQQTCDQVQITALDGNGDSFQVYHGPIRSLSAFHFCNVLRHPSCFYFFSVSAILTATSADLEDSVMQRDICWLTDPAPPTVQTKSHNTIFASWPFVSFCGIAPPAYVDSVQYVLEIAQGVEFKPGYLSRFISDVCAVDYRVVCAGPNIGSTTIQGLLPSRWYHLRLSVEYLGQRFVSESQAIHTPTWVPSTPGVPRVNVLPVLSSFDLNSEVPVRMDMIIAWNPSSPNGLKITRYQCHIQKFNAQGLVIQSAESQHRRERHQRNKTYYQSPERDPRANQWTQSPGRSMVQVHNSIVHGDRSPVRGRTAQARAQRALQGSARGPFSPDRLPDVNDSFAQTSSLVTSPEERRFKWEIAYDNILTNFKCASPDPDHAEWHIRVRTRNASGWSEFSPVFKMNGISHPSLFSVAPPPVCYGALYFAENPTSHYLDGTAGDQYRSLERTASQTSELGYFDGGVNVRNELFLHPRAPEPTKSPKKKKARTPKTPNTLKREESEHRAKQLADSMMTTTAGSSSNNNSAKGSFRQTAPAEGAKTGPPVLHVLHFKQDNEWEKRDRNSPLAGGHHAPETSHAHEFSSSLPARSSTKKSESLPSLGGSARFSSSNKALFSRS